MGNCTNTPKLIAVIGATGNQGGAVVNSLIGNSDFEIRAITRDPKGDKAQAIKDKVKEIVQADCDDEESLVKAFADCYGVFIVTNFWADMSIEHEIKTTKTIITACKKSPHLKHVVWSSLEDTRDFINKQENKDTWPVLAKDLGSYTPHFDGKGSMISEFLKEVPQTTVLFTTFYYENFIYFGMGPSKQEDSDPSYGITFPMGDAKLSMVAVEDIGKMVVACFKNPSTIGTTVGVQSTEMSCKDIAATFTKVLEVPVQYNAVTWDIYAKFPFPGADDLANMFRYYEENEKEFLATRDLSKVRGLMGKTVTLEEFIIANKEKFNVAP